MNLPVKTLIFDLDDTLVVEEASAEAAIIEAAQLAEAKYGIDPHELHTTLRKACRKIWYEFRLHPYCKRVGISSWEGLWAEFVGTDPNLRVLREWASAYRYESWQTTLKIHGIEDRILAAELAETFPVLRRGKHVTYPDTFRVLALFSTGYSLGLLTNGAPDLQRRKMEGAGVARYFDQIVISGDVGIGKPDPRVFEIILARLDADPKTSLMIGNNLLSDIKGAKDAGMRTVWVNRSAKIHDGRIIPDWEIARLDDLVGILKEL